MKKENNKNNLIKPALQYSLRIFLLLAFSLIFIFSDFFYQPAKKAFAHQGIERYSAGDVVSGGEENELTVHFIDVGQGDSCLIELPDNRTVLIDSGVNTNAVKNKLKTYITDLSRQRKDADKPEILYFDFVIITHSDADHCGSMAYILGLYPARTFYRPNEESTYSGYTDPANEGQQSRNRFWDNGNGRGAKNTVTYKNAIEAGYSYNKPQDILPEGIVTNPHDETQNKITPDEESPLNQYYEINFYGPVKSKYSDFNNYSPIIIIEYLGRRIALSGDSEKEGEADFVALANKGEGRYAVFNQTFYADIIKTGHHGSRTSTSQAYLDVLTTPDSISHTYIIISCGEGNSYGHPHAEIMDRLSAMNFLENHILRTDERGDIVISLVYNQEEFARIKLLGEEETTTPEEPKEDDDNTQKTETAPRVYFKICGLFSGNQKGNYAALSFFILIPLSALLILKKRKLKT